MWRGQYNALLLIALVLGGVAALIAENGIIFGVVLMLVITLRVCTGVINTVFKGLLGKPLIYDVKFEHRGDTSRAS